MNIEELVKRQDALIADMTKSLKERGFDAAVLARPIEMQEQRATSIKGRIAALENAKIAQVKAIDAEIGSLKTELETLGRAANQGREMLAPVLKGSKGGTTSGKAKATTKVKKAKG